MKIWWLDYHPAFNNLRFKNVEDFTAFESLVFGSPLIDKWIPPYMKYEDKGSYSDFVYQKDGALFISEKAKSLFETVLTTDQIEFLPVHSEVGDYFILNVLNVLDCVDKDRSKENRLPSGRLIGYHELEFIADDIQNIDIFRVKIQENNTVLDELYVSDRIRNVIFNSDLKGYQLTEIWDSQITRSEIEIKLNVMGELINTSLLKIFNFEKAFKVLKENNTIVYSGRNAMKQSENGDLVIGSLQLDGSYIWIKPYAVPPAFLYEEWGIKTKIKGEGFLSRIKEAITFR